MYNLQKNTAIFDDAQLYREHFGQRLTYDDYGRLTKSVDSMGRATTYEYVAAKRPEVSKITYADGTTTTYNYDPTTRRLLSVTDANGKVTTYSYDSDKNPTGSSMTAGGLTMASATTTYSGSYTSSVTDSLGNTVTYNYNQNNGILNSTTDPVGTVTTYTHNQYNDNLTKVAVSESDVDYTYTHGVLDTITRNSDSNTANDVKYTFVYDEFGNTKSVRVGTQPLITHTYAANNGLLTRSDYGNGAYSVPTYDSLDRVTAMSYNGVEKYNWVYGKDGNIGLHNDLVNDVTWRYEYTKEGDITSVIGSNGVRFNYTYDTATGKLLSVKTTADGAEKTTTYNYSDHTNGEDANLIESVVIPTATISYDYDDFYRASYDIKVNNSAVLSTDFTFKSGTAENSTT
ncbi:MAG: RHS repeat protein, partial [Clostridia bacterium]|nr:RHS repeat protein [Clostridia bacterium]